MTAPRRRIPYGLIGAILGSIRVLRGRPVLDETAAVIEIVEYVVGGTLAGILVGYIVGRFHSRRWLSLRRPLRFSLRTLLVLVTLSALSLGWLGYYVRWKHERQGARVWMRALAGGPIVYMYVPRPELPWMLRMLGEKPEPVIFLDHLPSPGDSKPPPPEYRRLVERAAELFPEAQIIDLTVTEADFVPEAAEDD